MVEVEADKVINLLDKLCDDKRLKQAVNECCLLVERDAKQNCPVLTGELRASITSRVEEDNTTITGTIGTPLMYGNYVEYGTGLFSTNGKGRTDVPWYYQDKDGNWISTSGQQPQPFLIPALNNNREEILRKIGKGVLGG